MSISAENTISMWASRACGFTTKNYKAEVAAHMVYAGEPGDALVEKGLAIAKAVHERLRVGQAESYNEIERSDHYARSMASLPCRNLP